MDVNQLIKRALNGRNISRGFQWLKDHYAGETRQAIRFKMDASQSDLNAVTRTYWLFHDAIQLGHGSDRDFTVVFR